MCQTASQQKDRGKPNEAFQKLFNTITATDFMVRNNCWNNINNKILLLKCPLFKAPFGDFDGCGALQCNT